ncbi:hypothetical protein [Roseicella aquatilis]|uniref:Uncharacterized protein n=1 Tax=Roseicella aquatilis TaxID=2527868 RepID=A0A4R4DZM4_9PROT|nr:hypothetical protein [Roseicella aquatilis]TCZ66843.1 hypothetical protein EXY23_01690 [Roseicella aquatilis]
MTRSRRLPPRLAPGLARGALCGLALAGLVACADRGRDPAISPVSLAPEPRSGPPAPIPSAPGGAATIQAANQGVRDQAAVAAACRRDAERIIVTRDRGQLMREDERDSRMGSQASPFSQRVETDRLGRLYERDRLMDQCIRENTRAAPQR